MVEEPLLSTSRTSPGTALLGPPISTIETPIQPVVLNLMLQTQHTENAAENCYVAARKGALSATAPRYCPRLLKKTKFMIIRLVQTCSVVDAVAKGRPHYHLER